MKFPIYVMAVASSVLFFQSCKKKSGDDPAPPAAVKISVEDLSLFEGNGTTNTFNVTLKLSAASSGEVKVNVSTTDFTAKAGEDFTALTNTVVSFPAGTTEKVVPVTVVADDIREGDDQFRVSLSGAVNATIQRGIADIIIRNDDTKVSFSNTGYDAPTSYPGYSLVWEDQFSGTSLDVNAWSHQNGDGCPNVCGWGNNELEYYTDRPSNLFFQDGKLIIEATKEAFGGKQYTSSKILTAGKKTFKYGRIDIRAILPKGKGIWPAFWMLPEDNVFGNWPKSGEIDIMEVVGHEPAKTHGTIHYGPGPGSTQISRSTSLTTGTLNDQFHVYSLEWKEDEIKWFLDGVLFSTIRKADIAAGTTWPFNEEFFLIFNLAVGGNWPGAPDATTYFPQWLIVDYIRVYQ